MSPGGLVDHGEFISNRGNRIRGGDGDGSSPRRLENVKVLKIDGRRGDYLNRLEITYCVIDE